MHFLKKLNTSKIWIFFVFLIAILFLAIQIHAQSKAKIEPVKVTKDVVPKSPQGLKKVAEVLGTVGGKSESGSFKMKISSGGQPSAIGKSQGTAFKISAGYVYSSFVLHGDANGNGKINISDVIYLINYVLKGGPAPVPLEAGDTDCDGQVNISDIIYLINYLFKGGPPPCRG